MSACACAVRDACAVRADSARSNGDLGVLRSKLGGLILLVNKTPVAERAKLA